MLRRKDRIGCREEISQREMQNIVHDKKNVVYLIRRMHKNTVAHIITLHIHKWFLEASREGKLCWTKLYGEHESWARHR